MAQDYPYPLVTVGGLIIAPDGEILLVESHKWNNCYTVPGGKVEQGETRESAFIREIQEETGLRVCNVRFAQTHESIFSPEFKQNKHLIMNDFIADLAPGCSKDQVVLNDEAEKFIWVRPERAKELKLNRELYKLIDWYLEHTPAHRKVILGKVGFDGHRINSFIGVHPSEMLTKQDLFVDLRVAYDVSNCALSDQYHDALCYVRLAELCDEVAAAKKFHLLEALAYAILLKIKNDYFIHSAWIRIKKPQGLSSAENTIIEMQLGEDK